ncbi:hypothetical protein N7520_011230 [Penicillium odoratum]|uniref:uncharacterized protein n=1 Tax=Penicillium odoratum TaxID=1167516 RepID=UPI0025499576|nr:uncharacterized protein N7520_011230 [Penicillium odoratum]KAJ5746048.1 hypothetical protein N7520_011230 [Penicillium odoratum]
MLLMVHYLQGSMTPNRSWHVIGIACRSAQALGLHSSVGDRHRSFAEIQIRRRVWHGCVMLDLAASTILGRPVMISQKPVTPRPEAIDDHYLMVDDPSSRQSPGVFSLVSWFVETLKLHEILRRILLTLYDNAALIEPERTEDHWKTRSVPDIRTIAEIDAELQNFTDGLPDALKWDAPIQNVGNESFPRERLLLKARFSYLKLLLYRPVLSQMLRDNKSPENHQGDHHRGIYAKYSLDCSVYCAMAAMDLVDLVHQTCTTELSSVWFYNLFYTFTAGSVILLAELSPPIVNAVTKRAIDEEVFSKHFDDQV